MFHGVILTEANNPIRIKTLGAYTIAHTLRQRGLSILVIDMFSQISQAELHELLDRTVTDQTLFVGYSGSLFLKLNSEGHEEIFPGGIERFESTNQYVKKLNPQCKILFGGSIANRVFNTVKTLGRSLGLDYVFYGYSDHMIVDFVTRLSDGRMQKCSDRAHGVGLIDYDSRGDLMPFRDNNHMWHESDIVLPGEALPIELARGCIFRCKFCSFPLLGKHKQDDSFTRSEQHVLSEILDNYERWGVTTYSIVDDTFNERTEKLESLLRIRDQSKIDLNFSGFLRLDLIARKPQQLPMLVDLNFRGLYFGIESLHQPSAQSIGKNIKTSEVKDWLHKIHHAFGGNTLIQAGFIIGLPHETEQTFREWADWTISDQCPINISDFAALYLSSSSHNESEFLRNPEQYGYRYQNGVKDSKWINDNWSWERCHELSKEYFNRSWESGRTRVGAFAASGLVKLGYDFNQVNHLSLKQLFSGEIQSRIAEYRNNYFNQLRKYLSII